MAMGAGPLDPFNHAVSFVVNCDDQAELDIAALQAAFEGTTGGADTGSLKPWRSGPSRKYGNTGR